MSSPQPFKLRLPKEITVEEVNVDRIDFNTAPPAQVDAVGRVYWDTTYNSLTVGLSANVQQKIGQALYKRARNTTGTALLKGEVVYISGSHALTELRVARADANVAVQAADTIGLVAEPIQSNSSGFIQVFGYMTGIRTNTYSGAEGSPLYLSETAGEMTSTIPASPAHNVRVGFMAKKAGIGAGSIFINIKAQGDLADLCDVLIGTKVANDFLTWDAANSYWKNTSLDGDKGDITVSSNAATWTIDNGVVNPTKLTTGAPSWTSGGDVSVTGDLTVTGNDIKSSTATAITMSGSSVGIAGELEVTSHLKVAGTGTPLSNGAGELGEIRFGVDTGTPYIYYCYSTDLWGRVALTTGY